MGWEYIYKVFFCRHSIHPTWCAHSLWPLDWNTLLGWWTIVQPDYCSAWTAWAQIKLFILLNFWKIINPSGIHFWVDEPFVQPDYCIPWAAWAQIKLFFIFSKFWKIINPTGIHFWVEALYSVLIVVHGRLGHKLNYFLFCQKLSTL